MIKWDLSQGCKNFSISANWSVCYTTLTDLSLKPYDHFNRCIKTFWSNSTLIFDTNSPGSGHRENLPQHKAICDKLTTNTIVNCEKLKAFPLRSGTILFNTVLESTEIREEKEIRHVNWIRKSKSVTICKWHNIFIENSEDATW